MVPYPKEKTSFLLLSTALSAAEQTLRRVLSTINSWDMCATGYHSAWFLTEDTPEITFTSSSRFFGPYWNVAMTVPPS